MNTLQNGVWVFQVPTGACWKGLWWWRQEVRDLSEGTAVRQLTQGITLGIN